MWCNAGERTSDFFFNTTIHHKMFGVEEEADRSLKFKWLVLLLYHRVQYLDFFPRYFQGYVFYEGGIELASTLNIISAKKREKRECSKHQS